MYAGIELIACTWAVFVVAQPAASPTSCGTLNQSNQTYPETIVVEDAIWGPKAIRTSMSDPTVTRP